MAAGCCNGGSFKNTGTPANQKALNEAIKLFLVPLTKANGTLASIANTDTIDAAYIEGKVEAANVQDRWYPAGLFETQDTPRADAVVETFASGNSAVVQQGVKEFEGHLIGFSPAYVSKLNSFACQDIGVYGIDKCGNLIGEISSDGTELYPIQVFNGSFDATYVQGTSVAKAKVRVRFEYSQTVTDGKLYVFPVSNISVDLLKVRGLIDMKADVSSIATTGATVELTVDFDSQLAPEPVLGVLLADFTLVNKTTDTSVAITSVTATLNSYALVYPAQDSGDVLELSALKNRKKLDKTTILIP